MLAAIRQTLTVKGDGALEICSPELRAGDRADVVVFVSQRSQTPDTVAAMTPLQALHALQASMKLTPEAAEKWIAEMRAERETWGNRL